MTNEKNDKKDKMNKWGKIKCSVCKVEKNATMDRVEKWKDKKYVCMSCRKKGEEK